MQEREKILEMVSDATCILDSVMEILKKSLERDGGAAAGESASKVIDRAYATQPAQSVPGPAIGGPVPKEYWEKRDVSLLGGPGRSAKKVDGEWKIVEKKSGASNPQSGGTVVCYGPHETFKKAVTKEFCRGQCPKRNECKAGSKLGPPADGDYNLPF